MVDESFDFGNDSSTIMLPFRFDCFIFLNREQLNLIITNNQSALIKFVNTCMILDTTQVVVEISQEVYDIFYFDKSYIFVCKCIATQIIYKT